MPTIRQFRTVFTGFTGAPGYSQLYFNESTATKDDQAAAVVNFWDAVAVQFPSSWAFAVDHDARVLDDSTGDLVQIDSTSPANQGIFGDAASYAGGSGACITWDTAAVHRTRRLRGRTFLVPLNSTKYDTTGTLASSAVTAIQAAIAALLSSGVGFGVWGRPVGGLNGLFAEATGGHVRDHVAQLRSRRD